MSSKSKKPLDFFATQDPNTVAELIVQNSKNSGRWDMPEKKTLIYPVTSALLKYGKERGWNFIQDVAQALADKPKGDGYKATTIPLALTGEHVPIFLPIDVFNPSDPWGQYFRESLSTVDYSGTTICEVGTGSGVVAIELIKSQCSPKRIVLCDIDKHVLRVAIINVFMNCAREIVEKDIRIDFYCGDINHVYDIVLPQLDFRGFDYILGCLPQVPAHGDDLTLGQIEAHEYDEHKYPEFEYWGLGLLYETQKVGLLMAAPDRSGKIILVHSGRVPQHIRDLFHQKLGVKISRFLLRKLIHHCPSTSFAYLFGHTASEPLLFQDLQGEKPVTPEEAEIIRQRAVLQNPHIADCGIFHYLFVIETERA